MCNIVDILFDPLKTKQAFSPWLCTLLKSHPPERGTVEGVFSVVKKSADKLCCCLSTWRKIDRKWAQQVGKTCFHEFLLTDFARPLEFFGMGQSDQDLLDVVASPSVPLAENEICFLLGSDQFQLVDAEIIFVDRSLGELPAEPECSSFASL